MSRAASTTPAAQSRSRARATTTFVNGLTQNSSNALTFQGSGTYAIGPNSSCSGSNYSICVTNSGVLSFTGTDTFSVSNGIYVNGGDTISMGGGTNNSFNIGKAGNGNAFYIGGGAKVDAGWRHWHVQHFPDHRQCERGGGRRQLHDPRRGGQPRHQRLVLDGGRHSSAPGTYTINGYLAYGNSGGGSVTCSGSTVGL